MVTYYNQKDLISFGNFLLERMSKGLKLEFPDGKHYVTDSDYRNWIEEIKGNKLQNSNE